MIKTVKYFFQAIIIYFFFIIIKLIGISLSRIFFSFLFNKVGPLIKSDRVVNDNLEKFLGTYNKDNDEKIKFKMWSNYGKVFVEYLFLKKFKKNNLKIVTTEKDFFRIKHHKISQIQCLNVELKIENKDKFEKEIIKCLF